MTEQEKINRALYLVFGVYPSPPAKLPDARTVAANNAVTAYQPINGAPVSYECNYGQQPKIQPPTEP